MKKPMRVCMVLLLALLATEAATAGGEQESAGSGVTAAAENPLAGLAVKDGKPLHLGYIVNEMRSGWNAAGVGYVKSLWERAGGDFTFFVSEYDMALELSQFNDLIQLNPDAILIHPSDSYAIAPAVKKAREDGYPVFAIDVGVVGADLDSFVRINQEDMGKKCAMYTEEVFSEDNPAVVLQIMGGLEQDIAVKRRAGFNNYVEKVPYITITQEIDTKWSSEKAFTAVMDALERNPDINSIYCHSDFMIQGVIEGLRQRKKLIPAGEEGHIVITSIDADPTGLKLLREGYLDAIAEHSPVLHVAVIVNAILSHLHGYPIPENVVLDPPLVTRDNVDAIERWGNMPQGEHDSWPVIEQEYFNLPAGLESR